MTAAARIKIRPSAIASPKKIMIGRYSFSISCKGLSLGQWPRYARCYNLLAHTYPRAPIWSTIADPRLAAFLHVYFAQGGGCLSKNAAIPCAASFPSHAAISASMDAVTVVSSIVGPSLRANALAAATAFGAQLR